MSRLIHRSKTTERRPTRACICRVSGQVGVAAMGWFPGLTLRSSSHYSIASMLVLFPVRPVQTITRFQGLLAGRLVSLWIAVRRRPTSDRMDQRCRPILTKCEAQGAELDVWILSAWLL